MEAQVNAFLASLTVDPAYSLSTRLAYANDLRVFLDFLHSRFARAPELVDFTTAQVAEFLTAERQTGRRLNTLHRRWTTVRRFAAYLVKGGQLGKDAVDPDSHLIKVAISGQTDRFAAQYLSPAQVDGLRAVIETSDRPRAYRDQAILSLLLETGLSVGMLVNLNLFDVDLRGAGTIHLVSDRNRDLWLPLGKALAPLNKYLRLGRPELNPATTEQALFVSQLGERMSRQGIWQILHHWGQQADPPVHLSPRLLRHTAVMYMSRSGRTLVEIQTLLGHSNPLSTQALLRRLKVENGGVAS